MRRLARVDRRSEIRIPLLKFGLLGIINAGVAQNWMLQDLLAPKLAALGSLDESTLHYQMPNGRGPSVIV